MKGLIYGLLLVLSSILAHAQDRPLPKPPSHAFPLGECPECERKSIQYQPTFGGLQPPAAEFGPSAPDGMSASDKESEIADFLGLGKLAAKNNLSLALTKVTDENDIWLLKSTLGALENAQIRMESWTEDTGLSCDLDENGFVQFTYPREIFICNRFINFFPDLKERTVAMAQLLIHEATHLAEIDDRTRIKGAPEGCRATYVETLVAQLTSRNHRPLYRTYDMDKCEKEGQD